MAAGRRSRTRAAAATPPKEAPKPSAAVAALKPELVPIADLKPHPRNYRKHPPEQIQQIIASLNQHGFYRNIVATRQGSFILAGHGVVQAARQGGYTEVPVIWLDLDPYSPEALKVLIGDNELSNLAEDDDRLLAETLKEIMQSDSLNGTGYDENQLVNLVFTTTRRTEIKDIDEARLWVGLPGYERQGNPIRLVLTFPSEADRVRFVEEHKISIRKKEERCWSAFWPDRPRARPRDLIWEQGSDAPAEQKA